jgi:predicted phage tail protein
MNLRALEVTAPLGVADDRGRTVAKRLGAVAAFYGVAALIGAAAVLIVAFVLRTLIYVPRIFAPPQGMSAGLFSLLLAWGVSTSILIVLLIYRSTLSFLDENETKIKQEQMEIRSRVNRIDPLVRVLGAASGFMTLVIVAALIYVQSLH